MTMIAPPPPPKRVLLFFPVFSHVWAAAFQNFLRLLTAAVHNCPQYAFDPWVVSRSSVHGAMNQAVDAALIQGHDYLIAFDDDCLPELTEFPLGDPRRWQVIPRLLALGDTGKYPIVTGVGYMRGFPYTTTVGRHYPHGMSMVLGETPDQDVFKGFQWVDDLSYLGPPDENGLIRADFAGVPIICIHRSVLERVPRPLFETRDEGGGQCTHDVYFCNKARDHGFSLHVDTHIDCGHIVEAPIINRTTKAAMRAAIGDPNVTKQTAQAGRPDAGSAHPSNGHGPSLGPQDHSQRPGHP